MACVWEKSSSEDLELRDETPLHADRNTKRRRSRHTRSAPERSRPGGTDQEEQTKRAAGQEEQDKRTSVDDDKFAAELDAALDEHCRDMTSAPFLRRS